MGVFLFPASGDEVPSAWMAEVRALLVERAPP